MADDTTKTGEDTSWWDLDVFPDSELPSTSFDEPLEWPETLDWGELSAAEGDLPFPGTVDLESEPIFPPTSHPEPSPPEAPAADTQWQATGDDGDSTMPHATVLSGLGGGAPPPVANAAEHTAHERLPDSLWAGGAGAGGNGVAPVLTTTIPAPSFHAEPDGGGGGWRRRFDIRHGNAAVIALISCVSLILLGMFMSVRARNELPDTSQTRTTSDPIQVHGTLNTVPLTTTVTTTPAPINIADLIPPAEDAPTATAGTGAGSGGSGGSEGGTPATTAAPARSAPSAGGGGGTASQPAAQSTNTTAAPQSTGTSETTTPTVTSPPVTQTTMSTPRRTTPTFPSITSTVPDNDGPTMPSFPGFPGFSGFGN